MGCVDDARQVTDNQGQSRFQLRVGSHVAELMYWQQGNRLVLIHTEVPVELEGSGIGGSLVTAAIDRAVRDGLTIVPSCPCARNWLRHHPDTAGRAVIAWATRT
jgi:predicted GNAT family acetyltransferase